MADNIATFARQPESGQWFKLLTYERPGRPVQVVWRPVDKSEVDPFALRIELPPGCHITTVARR
jgi:hypothetical protein